MSEAQPSPHPPHPAHPATSNRPSDTEFNHMDYQHRAFDYTFQQIIAAVAKISLVRDAAVVKVCRVVSGDSAKTQSAAGAGPWLDLAPSFFALVQTAFVASRIVPGAAATLLATAPFGTI